MSNLDTENPIFSPGFRRFEGVRTARRDALYARLPYAPDGDLTQWLRPHGPQLVTVRVADWPIPGEVAYVGDGSAVLVQRVLSAFYYQYGETLAVGHVIRGYRMDRLPLAGVRTVCPVANIRAHIEVDDDISDRVALDAMLYDDAWTAEAISEELALQGYDVSDRAITRHRNLTCACGAQDRDAD